MEALSALLHEQEREEAWRAYMAQMGWYAARALWGKEFKHPSWMQMTAPKQQDSRSGAQIVRDVADQLRHRRKKRAKQQGRRE